MATAATAGEDWLTINEGAAWLEVSKTTLYRRIAAGELPAVKLGGVGPIRIPASGLEEFLERSLIGSPTAGASALPSGAPANPREAA